MSNSLDSDAEFLQTSFPIATMFVWLAHEDPLNKQNYGNQDGICCRNFFQFSDLNIQFVYKILVAHCHHTYLSRPFARWKQHSRTLVNIADMGDNCVNQLIINEYSSIYYESSNEFSFHMHKKPRAKSKTKITMRTHGDSLIGYDLIDFY